MTTVLELRKVRNNIPEMGLKWILNVFKMCILFENIHDCRKQFAKSHTFNLQCHESSQGKIATHVLAVFTNHLPPSTSHDHRDNNDDEARDEYI